MLTQSGGRRERGAWKDPERGRAPVMMAGRGGGICEALSPYRIHLVECINGLKGLLLFWLNLVAAEWGKGGFCHQLELP